jgi:hypothetical protein
MQGILQFVGRAPTASKIRRAEEATILVGLPDDRT